MERLGERVLQHVVSLFRGPPTGGRETEGSWNNLPRSMYFMS